MSILEASGLTVVIDDKIILQDCSVLVGEGEFVGIIGPNGSGKTTFLKALRGLIPLAKGKVLLAGQELPALQEKEIARQVAYMQQDVNMGFGYSAKDIVMTARYPYLKWWQNEGPLDEKIVEQAMRFTGVWDLRDQTVNTVSGGERQRVFLAKAMAQQTDILLLDEPTAALDMVYADEIFRYCRQLCKQGKTIILVVHDLEMAAKFCTRMILFSHGRIVSDGWPKAVLTADHLSKAFHLSSCVYPDPFFQQLRIYVYPNGEREIERYRIGLSPLPPEATVAVVPEDGEAAHD